MGPGIRGAIQRKIWQRRQTNRSTTVDAVLLMTAKLRRGSLVSRPLKLKWKFYHLCSHSTNFWTHQATSGATRALENADVFLMAVAPGETPLYHQRPPTHPPRQPQNPTSPVWSFLTTVNRRHLFLHGVMDESQIGIADISQHYHQWQCCAFLKLVYFLG